MTTKQNTTNQSITQRAMLISLSISYWGGKTGDARMVDDIVASRKNERDTVEARKVLIKPEALNAPKAVRSRARSYFFEKTSPWIDGGTRVLASNLYFELCEKMREFESEYEQTVLTSIIKPYSALKGEARKRLGDLYKDEDYPSVEQLKAKFSWKMSVLPIPDKGDWRVDLGNHDNGIIQKQIDDQVKQACATVTRDLYQRLHKVVTKLTDTLKDADATFRDSLLTNITEICDMLPVMNVAGDPGLEKLAADARKALTAVPAATLREDPKKRKAVKNAADDLLAKMAGYIGGGK